MKLNITELYALVRETKRARGRWRQTGLEPYRIYYESLYLTLGRVALNRTQTLVTCPGALYAMFLLAKDAD